MSRRHGHSGIGDSKILQRKIPSSGKYTDVKPRVDTGSSMTRYMKGIEEMQSLRMKNNEIFRRMKATTLAQLVLQVANVSMQEEDSSISDLASARSGVSSVTLNGGDNTDRRRSSSSNNSGLNGFHDDDDDKVNSPRSSLQSVIRGVGEVDMMDNNKHSDNELAAALETPYPDCPYLLLDVRDQDEYAACHIVGAKSYPIAMLSRTMNNFTREILEFKNCPGRIIIIYDEDERIGTVAASTMVERGFDNMFLLSGGLKILAQKIPEGIVTGTYPLSCRVPGRRSGGNQVYNGPPANPKKCRFSADDLDRINHYLEESLVPQDTGSRLSRLTNTSRRSNVSSKASTMTNASSVSNRRAWR
uniref:centrosomal protein of 41 kDa isoform X1 n=1 Tax=Ciona intestinalis TaxID=7719 RepID=UPI0000521BB0|nr:centrosomal protein of 41 kDa isoform X1 [Ciona intestinalis]|eukprot:XP_002124082.1 centrosomal protein of 41 kDa isoform X1 [Ciona intestinalis]